MAAQPTCVLEAGRVPVEAIDDLDWFANEAGAEMGEGSTFGAILDRASLEHEWCKPDLRDLHDKTSLRDPAGKPIGHYGESFGGRRWTEWVEDPAYDDRGGGYVRDVWGARAHQTPMPEDVWFGERQKAAADMARNVSEVLVLMSIRLQAVVLARAKHSAHGVTMRARFGENVRIVAFSRVARDAFNNAAERLPNEDRVYTWLEGVALRVKAGKPRAGEKTLLDEVSKEMATELSLGYQTFEWARSRLPPPRRRFPHHSRERHARRLSLVGA